MKSYHTIAFDLDGTLTDPTSGLTRGFSYALKKLSMPPEPPYALKRFIGPPLREQFQRDYGMNEEEANQAVALFREYFSVYGWWDNRLYGGIRELLSQIKARGKRIILATSKPEIFAAKILKLFEIDEYFDFVGAASLDRSRENKIQVLEYALRESGADIDGRNGVLMVGDTKYDIEGANAVGVDSLGVLYGFGTEGELRREGATYIAGTVHEIINYII